METHPRSASRRFMPRANCSLHVKIAFEGISLCEGIIKDISVSGVRMLVPRGTWLPLSYEIETEAFDKPVKVKTVWRNREHVGARIETR